MLQVCRGDVLQVAVDLFVEHTVFVAAGPDAPAIVIDDIGHQQMALWVASELDFQVNECDIHRCPGAFERFKHAASLLRHPLYFRRGCQSHSDDIGFPDLRVVARVVFQKGLDQHRLEARPLADLRVPLEVGAGGDAPHHLLDGQHLAATYQQRYVVDLLDEVGVDILLI